MPDDFVFEDIVEQGSASSPVIFPRQTLSNAGRDIPLSNEEAKEIMGENRRLYVRSLTRYDDVFGEPHETSFCVRVGGPLLQKILQGKLGESQAFAFDVAQHYNYAT